MIGNFLEENEIISLTQEETENQIDYSINEEEIESKICYARRQ